MDYKKSPKVAKNRHCELCDYTCCKDSDYAKHILTSKHQRSYKGVTMDEKKSPKVAIEFDCKCGNKYKYRQGLYKHQKNCSIHQGMNILQIGNTTPTFEVDKELLVKLLLKNQDVMEKMIELMPKMGNQSNNNNNTNSNNNFNIQMFLNGHNNRRITALSKSRNCSSAWMKP